MVSPSTHLPLRLFSPATSQWPQPSAGGLPGDLFKTVGGLTRQRDRQSASPWSSVFWTLRTEQRASLLGATGRYERGSWPYYERSKNATTTNGACSTHRPGLVEPFSTLGEAAVGRRCEAELLAE